MARGFKIITQESSPYTVPTGKRVLAFSFVGGTGGGTLTITAAGGASDAVTLAEGKSYGLTLPADGVPIIGGGDVFAWTNAARYAVVLL